MRERGHHHRRKRTRGALLLFALLVAVVLAGTDALMRQRPVADTSDLVVTGLPPASVSAANPRTCLRGVEASGIEDIRSELRPGERISSAQIEGCPQAFDGLRILYAGEAIGEVLPRRGGAWLQVNDDDYALEVGPLGRHDDRRGFNAGLSVWLPDGLHEEISGFGGPDRRGDVLLLEGQLLRADPADGGGTTLRAERMTVLAPSVELAEPLHVLQVVVAVVLGSVAIGALVWSARARRL
jgi:hypothetical protein